MGADTHHVPPYNSVNLPRVAVRSAPIACDQAGVVQALAVTAGLTAHTAPGDKQVR